MQTGTILKNGAEVIKAERRIVLAQFRGEFVTWQYNRHDASDTYWGHYFGGDISAAVKDFEERVAKQTHHS